MSLALALALAAAAGTEACAAGAACVAGAACDLLVGAARATHTTQTMRTATAHMTRVKRRFMRPQSANSSGFMVRFGVRIPRAP